MAIKHVQDFEFPSEFGFSGSSNTSDKGDPGPQIGKPPKIEPTHAAPNMPAYADGGHHPHGHHPVHTEHHEDGRMTEHHAHGGMTVHHPDGHMTHHHHDGSPAHGKAEGGMEHHMHPHGHEVTRVEHHADGRVVHHHAHGGHSVHHKDGRITHHEEGGAPAYHAMGGMEHHDGMSEYVHRAKGGHMEDREMIQEADRFAHKVEKHERGEMKGHAKGGSHHDSAEHEDVPGYAMGNMVRRPMMHPGHAGAGMPMNRPPMNPKFTPSARNAMPGGQMGMGVQPSSEPDMAGSEQGIPQLAHGGRHKRKG